MTFKEIPSGLRVFLDANVFIYHFGGLSQDCRELLERCERGEMVGVTSTHILLEVLHRLMVAEAVARGLISAEAPLRKIRENPQIVCQLRDYHHAVGKIPDMGIEVLPLEWSVLQRSRGIRERYGLLTNDSVVVALMLSQGIGALATRDEDFDRVKEIQVYKPSDI